MSTLKPRKTVRSRAAATSAPRWREQLRRRILEWYATAARDLPWRRDLDPYRVWVSEIMLQQTQVATVVPYFERFITAFPTVVALAAAPEDDVLRLWEGLGYYRRARHMQHAAQQIMARHGGVFPTTLDEVRALPGIGRYTAGAILSIAYGAREPILEANTVRLYSRLIGYRGDVSSSPGQQLLWQFAHDVLPNEGAGTVNQALMELGSQICTPREPRCLLCPLSSLCVARARGWQQQIPKPKPRPQFEAVEHIALVVWRRNRILLVRRHDDARWARFWDFP